MGKYMNTNSDTGNQWRLLRERAGLTQAEVADNLGYSTPQFISNVERGRCRYPIEKLGKIKKIYRLSNDQIVNLILADERLSILKVFRKSAR